jgi:hypothetical protein
MTKVIKQIDEYRQRLPIGCLAIALFTIVLTYVDGFWLTALQGVIGAVERLEPPFTRWIRDSSIMLPLVLLAVVFAARISRRWVERSRHAFVRIGAVALLITLISSVVGIGATVISSFRDYQFQSRHLELMHSYGVSAQPSAVDISGFGAAPVTYSIYCNLRGVAANNAITLMEYATFTSHVRAVVFMSGLLLITNLVLVLALMALLGQHLWATSAAAKQRNLETSSQLAPSGALI